MKLANGQFSRAGALLPRPDERAMLLESVLQGDLGGSVYIDSFLSPRAALVISRLKWVYLMGEGLHDAFEEEVVGALEDSGAGTYLWFEMAEFWKERIALRFSCRSKAFTRWRFSFSRERFESARAAPPCDIREIGPDNAEKIFAKYYPDGGFWDTPDRFLERGFGYCVESAGRPVSLVISAGVSDAAAEIDIQTDEEHRGKGFAGSLCRVFIARCLASGLQPRWDCADDNEGSIRLAGSLGFEKSKPYTLTAFALSAKE